MHVTTDRRAIARLLIARCRDVSWEGIVDACLLGRTLHLLHGDSSFRGFPLDQVPTLRDLEMDELGRFEVDADGSFLYWPAADVHLGVSQLLQPVDPSILADVEVRRYPASAAMGAFIAELRENRGLRQRRHRGCERAACTPIRAGDRTDHRRQRSRARGRVRDAVGRGPAPDRQRGYGGPLRQRRGFRLAGAVGAGSVRHRLFDEPPERIPMVAAHLVKGL